MSEGDPENGDFSENPEPEADSEFVPDSNLTVEDEQDLNRVAGADQPEDELCNLNGVHCDGATAGVAESSRAPEHDQNLCSHGVEEEQGQALYSDGPEDGDCNSSDSTPVHRPLSLSNHTQRDSPSVSNDSTPVHVPNSPGQLECSVSGSDNEGTEEASAEGASESGCGADSVSSRRARSPAEVAAEMCHRSGDVGDNKRTGSDDAEAAPEDEVMDSESATSTAGSVVEDTPECDQGIGSEANGVQDSWRTTNICVLGDVPSDSSVCAVTSYDSSNSLQMAPHRDMLDACASSSSESLEFCNISVKELLKEEISDDDEEEMLNFKKNISDMVSTSFNTSCSSVGGQSSLTNHFTGASEQLNQESAATNSDSLNVPSVAEPSADAACVENVEARTVPDTTSHSKVSDKTCDTVEPFLISVEEDCKTSGQASEEDLLSELDAELQTHSKDSTDHISSSDPSAILPSVDDHQQTVEQNSGFVLCPGMLPSQFQENSSPPNGLKMTESDMMKGLQGQLSHMHKLLEESGGKFKR